MSEMLLLTILNKNSRCIESWRGPTCICYYYGRRTIFSKITRKGDEVARRRMMSVAAKIARERGLAEDGYRLMINCKAHGGQGICHIHLHLLGGRLPGLMLTRLV